ncbi:CDGSH iron-sulfur domain-containing protein [candidate division KSB1 bacterium]|nr:CDGSH iron-sulfur domain-containing protein [candidate division KSB1 bacterium]
MAEKIHKYEGAAIIVHYDGKRCLHAAECVRGLPAVFNFKERRWVQPDNATANEVAAIVERCPTGALHFVRKDGAAEAVPDANIIRTTPNGPHYVRGDIRLVSPEGSVHAQDTRVALCRCGASQNKPYCDARHLQIHFQDAATWTHEVAAVQERAVQSQGLNLTPLENAPLKLEGEVAIFNANGEMVFRGNEAYLCRCGASRNKPFCDDSHARIGFNSA